MEAEEERYDSAVGPCPSFNSYSADSLSDVALRVSREDALGLESEFASIDLNGETQERDVGGGEEDDDFEFVSLVKKPGQVAMDGGWRGLVFPVFNRDLLFEEGRSAVDEEQDHEEDERSIRIPLKSLFMADRDPPSCSSSEADELEGVPEGTYCVWTPRPSAAPSPSRCKKSNSTGSCSKRWRFRDLLRRSNSDGKDAFVFLTPSSSSAKLTTSSSSGSSSSRDTRSSTASENRVAAAEKSRKTAAKEKSTVSAHEQFYIRSRALKEGDKRRSYLPYRKDLVGFFANVNGGGNNGLGRTFPPF